MVIVNYLQATDVNLFQKKGTWMRHLGKKILNMMCMFESVFCAQKAKAALNGADIYAGCCTLKIEYARVMLGPSLLLLLAKYLYSRLNLFHFYFI